MPAPGDQYSGGDVKNPFERRVVNEFTALEIATLQSRLNKQLGPEYISQRPGNGGGRVAYLEGNKAIALANEVFGFNGWSSSLGQVQIDYVDEHQSGKVSLGLSIVVRITLKDGTFHEDIGYGSIENGKGKAASFEKAKKEAATDGLKRSLRTFGNVLGNCLYDKEYLKKVQAMKVKPIRFEENNLYRHRDFALPVPEGQSDTKREQHRTPVRPNQALRTRTEHLGESMSADFDDEFDGNLFDGVEITEHHDDAFTFESAPASNGTGPKTTEVAKSDHGTGEVLSDLAKPKSNGGLPDQPNANRQPTPVARGPGGVPQQRPSNQGPARPQLKASNQRGLQTPVQQQNYPRPEQARPMVQPTSDIHKTASQQPNNGHQPSNGQSLKPTPPQAQQQAANHARSGPQAAGIVVPSANASNAGNRPPVGFVTSRAAELLQKSDTSAPLSNIPAFNPHAESPLSKEQRTPGLDHTRSVPVKRQENATGAAPPAQGGPRTAPVAGGAGFGRANIGNQNQEANRRIGMPGATGYAMSPSANRGAYKPPTFANGAHPNALKRERVALQDVSNANPNGNSAGEGHETKRQRIEAPDAENAGVGALNSS